LWYPLSATSPGKKRGTCARGKNPPVVNGVFLVANPQISPQKKRVPQENPFGILHPKKKGPTPVKGVDPK